MKYNKEEILKALDDADNENPYMFFPNLEHPYSYPVMSKMHLFADNDNWAIVFELCEYSNRGNCLNTQLTYFGSNLFNLDESNGFICNTKFIDLVSQEYLMEVSNIDLMFNEEVKKITVNHNEVEIERNVELYKNFGIEVTNDIDVISFFGSISLTV